MTIPLTAVQSHNSTLSSHPSGLVAVFVGGTSGIGLFTARELARTTTAPHIYLVGRNGAEATRIADELRTINAASTVDFIQKDVSLLRNVDDACAQIKAKEDHINLLFMTCGYLTIKGREETEEGLDRKFSLHYYARMRFVQQLAPLLDRAASAPDALSRVVAVLDPRAGQQKTTNFADLSLKTSFSLANCATHAGAMTNFAFEHFAKTHPRTAFVHAVPSVVETGAMRGSLGVLQFLEKPILFAFKPFFVPQKESGERHLFAATAPRYAPRASAGSRDGVVEGGDGVKGSGSYLLNWNGDVFRDTDNARAMRKDGAERKIWEHTEDVFKKVCEEGKRY